MPTPVEYWDYDHDLHAYCQRDLNYQAPEYVLDQKLDPSNDMFGIGCLAYSVLNKGTTLFSTRGNLNTYRQQIERISSHQFDKLPAHLTGRPFGEKSSNGKGERQSNTTDEH